MPNKWEKFNAKEAAKAEALHVLEFIKKQPSTEFFDRVDHHARDLEQQVRPPLAAFVSREQRGQVANPESSAKENAKPMPENAKPMPDNVDIIRSLEQLRAALAASPAQVDESKITCGA